MHDGFGGLLAGLVDHFSSTRIRPCTTVSLKWLRLLANMDGSNAQQTKSLGDNLEISNKVIGG
jgi:hypothetical protein